MTDADGNPIGRNFKNNVYTEFVVQAEDSNIEILSDVRLKVGIMFPFKGKEQSFSSKPKDHDIEHRISLSIPLGKIFKF